MTKYATNLKVSFAIAVPVYVHAPEGDTMDQLRFLMPTIRYDADMCGNIGVEFGMLRGVKVVLLDNYSEGKAEGGKFAAHLEQVGDDLQIDVYEVDGQGPMGPHGVDPFDELAYGLQPNTMMTTPETAEQYNRIVWTGKKITDVVEYLVDAVNDCLASPYYGLLEAEIDPQYPYGFIDQQAQPFSFVVTNNEPKSPWKEIEEE